MDLNLGPATWKLCKLEQITYPSGASVSPSVKDV